MALLERFFPVVRYDWNFFDRMTSQMDQEFAEMERQMSYMRDQMFQLVQMHPEADHDVRDVQIFPKSPIVEESGLSKLKLEFNVKNFKPEEVAVKVVGNNILQVEGKHEAKTDTSHELHTYFRQYQLPEGVVAESIKPSLTKDGVLVVEAPAPALKPQERKIPIEYKKD